MSHVALVFPNEPSLDHEDLGTQRNRVDGPVFGAEQLTQHGFVLVVQRFDRRAARSQLVAVDDGDAATCGVLVG